MSARETIFAWLDARLAAVGGVLEYEREPSGDPARFPALHLLDGGEARIEGGAGAGEAGTTAKALRATVQGFVKGASGGAAHGALNALHAAAVKALLTDPPLGGLSGVTLIEEEGELRIEVADLAKERHLGFAQDFRIEYAHPRGDPTNLA